MANISQILLLIFFVYSLIGFSYGLKNKKNPYGLAKLFLPLGAFVWVDTIVFGLFFSLTSLVCLVLKQPLLFLLIYSVFWAVRSIGEQVYWFLEQFAIHHRNPPHTLWPKRWFKGEESWIVMQTVWQCVTVVSIVASVYLFVLLYNLN